MDGTLTRERYLEALEQDVVTMVDHLTSGDLTIPVRSCPGWDLGDLCGHLGVTHRWAIDALSSSTPPAEGTPPSRDELAAWFRDGADRLLAALRGTDPTTECWGFGPKPRTVAFWVRRQALETAVHAWDAATALGRPAAVAPDLAADGVDEVARMFYLRQVRLGRRDLASLVADGAQVTGDDAAVHSALAVPVTP